jgi:hypothetical protein
MYDPEKVRQEYESKRKEQIAYVRALVYNNEMLDDDGYPTEACLEAIANWHFSEAELWFAFIREHWHLADWGWTEGEADHEYKENEKVYRYDISTAGWSGNEMLIRAMEANQAMWHLNWVQSRRGGHYIFELYRLADEAG